MSISKLQIGLSESRKPCLNLRSRRWLEPRRSLVRCLIPLVLKQIYVLLGEGLINCKILVFKSSVIRQKGETQTGDSRKESTPNFPKNEHFLPPDTHTSVLRFALLPYYRRFLKDFLKNAYNDNTLTEIILSTWLIRNVWLIIVWCGSMTYLQIKCYFWGKITIYQLNWPFYR